MDFKAGHVYHPHLAGFYPVEELKGIKIWIQLASSHNISKSKTEVVYISFNLPVEKLQGELVHA